MVKIKLLSFKYKNEKNFVNWLVLNEKNKELDHKYNVNLFVTVRYNFVHYLFTQVKEQIYFDFEVQIKFLGIIIFTKQQQK